MGPFTLIDVILAAVSRERTCVAKHKIDGEWTEIRSKQLRDSVVALARMLQEWGVKKGERIAILSENRPEWAITDFAALSVGAVDVTIYATLTEEQASVILKDSGARIAFVSSQDQLQKILSIQEQTAIEKIIVFDSIKAESKVPVITWTSLFSGAGEPADAGSWEKLARTIKPDDLATIIYTSGTTGTPKGVMLTHGNIASNMSFSLAMFNFVPGDSSISFLPLSHITA